ncbi:hypothetical protein BV898_06039 [Hypsibius exemplaris]|uniref:Protein kinase domain-containing protein n=1 Tax=Hypsibius exemplaris TaxID=2072580 RepID=A0A1W0WXV3_HYPEX|nr:hypothetical protein BV898_06039 [Hypsibius exemplaris]
MTRTFSQQTDVWSYGVLMWEIYSMGHAPFAGSDVAKLSAHGFADWLMEGHQMCRPTHAVLKVYELMRSCWCLDPDGRPTFATLEELLDNELLDSSPLSPYLCLEEKPDIFRELDDKINECMALD